MERNNMLTNKNKMNQFLYDPNQRGDMQMLTVNLSIPIPADSVLISKIQLEESKRSQLEGVYWTMKDLQKRINKKSEWIKTHILYPEKFRKILDSDNGGFVYYPKSQGQSWAFLATKMSKFLDDNFDKFFSI
jgi:phage pi2 protein 07